MFSLTGTSDEANLDNAEDLEVCGDVWGFPADYENKPFHLVSFRNPE